MMRSIKVCLGIICLLVIAETFINIFRVSTGTFHMKSPLEATSIANKCDVRTGSESECSTVSDFSNSISRLWGVFSRLMASFSKETWDLATHEPLVLRRGVFKLIDEQDVQNIILSRTHNESLSPCPEKPPGLVGVRASNQTQVSQEELTAKFPFLKPGGDYHPPDCRPSNRTVVIIPYRNRWQHLHILLNNLIPFLLCQQTSFTIYVIEMEMPTAFNRALLLNAGVLESLKRDNYTCFVFHDVDLVPLDDHNLYRCGSNPRHLAVGVSKYNYNMPYWMYTGGASAMSKDQLFAINGNSNLYFGWGGEDDDLHYRIRAVNMSTLRYPAKIARYYAIKHQRDKENEDNPLRVKLLEKATTRMHEDGLNSVRYNVTSIELKPLYTWIRVNVNMNDVLRHSHESVRSLFANLVAK